MESESEFYAIKSEIGNSVTSVEQFDQICRCCLSEENEICSVFEVQYDGKNFSDLLQSCASVRVSILFNINGIYTISKL